MFITSAIKELLNTFSTEYKTPLDVEIKKISRKDLKILKKSLSLRVIDAGDDEGTMAELYALGNRGKHFVHNFLNENI